MEFLFTLGIFASVIAAVSHVILKKGADKKAGKKTIFFFLNWYTVLGYGLMFGSTLMNLHVFKFLELKYAFLFYPITFVLVFILSIFLLKEKVTKRKLLSYCLIVLGIFIFNI